MIELFKLKNKAKLKSVALWRTINDVLVALIILILSACVASVIFQMI